MRFTGNLRRTGRAVSLALGLAACAAAHGQLVLSPGPAAPHVSDIIRTPISVALDHGILYMISQPVGATAADARVLSIYTPNADSVRIGRGAVRASAVFPVPETLVGVMGSHLVGYAGDHLLIYDVADVARPALVGDIGGLQISAVRILAGAICVAGPNGISMFGAADGGGVAATAFIPLANVRDVARIGNVLFALHGQGAQGVVAALDVEATGQPAVLAEANVSAAATEIAGIGDLVLLSNGAGALRWNADTASLSPDNTTVTMPHFLVAGERLAATGGSTALELTMANGALVSQAYWSQSGAFTAIDATTGRTVQMTPQNSAYTTRSIPQPTIRTHNNYSERLELPVELKWAAVDGAHAYVSDDRGLVYVVDISDITAPFVVSNVVRSGQILAASGSILITRAGVCDVSDPTKPRNANFPLSVGSIWSQGAGFVGSTLVAAGRLTTFADTEHVGTSRPTPPEPAAGVAVYGNRFLTYSGSTLRLYEFHPPAAPVLVATRTAAHPINSIWLGAHVGAATVLQTELFDLSDPLLAPQGTLPYLVNETGYGESNNPRFVGDRFYVQSGAQIYAIDCRNPAAPVQFANAPRATGSPQEKYKGFAAAGSYLVVENADGGIFRIPSAGDLNGDSRVDFFDIDPFVLAIVDPVAHRAAFPLCARENADMNNDGRVDNFDIDAFVFRITNP